MNNKFFILGFCLCGCNTEINIRNKLGLLARFVKGHNSRLIKGKNRYNWKNGICKDHKYLSVLKPDHHKATSRGRVLQHRLVYEEYYNCCLLFYTEIHHINGDTKDNRIENLQPLYKSQHIKLEKTKSFNRNCLLCGINESRDYKNNNHWNKYKNGYICQRCYLRLYRQKRKSEKT